MATQILQEIYTPGLLPPGVHPCTLAELRGFAVFNQARQEAWYRLVSFLAWPVLVRPRFVAAYVGGSFLSQCPAPQDIDVILETRDPYGPESFATIERFFKVGLKTIQELYSVDLYFWMDGAPSGLSDYRTFFQYERSRREEDLLTPARGLFRISLESLTPAELRREMSPPQDLPLLAKEPSAMPAIS